MNVRNRKKIIKKLIHFAVGDCEINEDIYKVLNHIDYVSLITGLVKIDREKKKLTIGQLANKYAVTIDTIKYILYKK